MSGTSDVQCPRRAAAASGLEVDGKPFVLDRSTGSMHVLNDVAAEIWARLDGSSTMSSLVAELSDAFDADPARVERDVQEFIAQLGRLGLLEGSAVADDVELARTEPDRDSWSVDTAWVDWYAGQVIAALRENGVEAILLKGPAISRWLYRDAPGDRGYIDADVLVAERDLPAAEAVLSDLGFRHEDARGLERIAVWATSWRRHSDGAVVDLHRTLHGCEQSAINAWPIVSATAASEDVGGVSVALPSIPVRALEIALVGPDDRPWRRWNDLNRALEQLSIDEWRETAALAEALGVERMLGYRLSQSAAGARCAERLGLKTAPAWWLRWEADPMLRWIALLAAVPTMRARVRLATQLITPPVSYVRSRDPAAAPGSVAGAYAAWAVHVLRLLPGAARTLLRSLLARRAGR